MEKKQPYRFSIGLNSKLPQHVAVAEILNDMGRCGISQLIVDAVWAYYHSEDSQQNIQPAAKIENKGLDQDDIQNLMSSLDMFSK